MRNTLFYIITLIFFAYNAYADDININIKEATINNNIRYLYVEHHDLPTISLTLAFKKAGYAYDASDKQGLAHFTSQILQEGSESNHALEFAKQLEGKGIDLKFHVDIDNFYISIKTLSENFEEALTLLSDCLFNPVTDPEIFHRVIAEQSAHVKSLYGSPKFIAATEINHAIFKGHPYSNKIYGTLNTINNITQEDVSSYIKNSFDKDQIVISAAGDIDSAKLSNLLDKYILSKLPSGNNKNTIPDATVNREQKLLYVRRNVPQSVIMFATDTVSYNDEDYYASNLFNNMLGGLSLNSILMIELRDKLGLTYHASSMLDNMNHSNVLLGIITTDNTTVTKCISVLKEIIENIKNNGINQETFLTAKSSITNSFILSMLNNDNVANTLLNLQLRGLDPSYINKHNSYYKTLTIEEVTKVARKILSNDLVIIEVGKNNNINGKQIEAKENILG
ncbi:peptidase M16 inactive domain protein [Ehrlichia chaffeensis str. Heartland]|uniref:Peptidase, M16 family n=1 Tax=Ehrlichia chaffeensis (strain ATCC CRL-10679 / Arkansas) TaxID=205920 RepID=Q2GFE0_EHRCR|nr:pitrilysin family protein [Ehrlichia chaffeensis]ABD45122.1 peptidase, M16 family [Ehrlichia chaffeensis str. Arkansas]AHX03291.1 peptidase M16 inactive domain protein [Ehrlichia chaffeensis str. Heartland]AHX06197.1 peptidase M16 inactive domain protein [Ehrlichia chaffeensis str. Liberty]AHX07705.1 peptidase M16 inactive domain protein [Ehrlichia chaffeensis str. Osceola]AHX08978.1 peptidase M16 inactive domain protein [Ehrlichia chaffeensis str. Saint Vincent]